MKIVLMLGGDLNITGLIYGNGSQLTGISSSVSNGHKIGYGQANYYAIGVTANYIYSTKVKCDFNTTISHLIDTFHVSVSGAKFKMAIYSNNEDGTILQEYPETVLGTTAEHTFPSIYERYPSDGRISLALATEVNLVAGTTYWLSILSDTNLQDYAPFGAAASVQFGQYKARTYADGFPNYASIGSATSMRGLSGIYANGVS